MKLITEKASLKFSELFEGVTSRSEVVCTFLALLELIRLKQLVCVQENPFTEIEIQRGNAPVVAQSSQVAPETSAARQS
jgi:segregation and condensation protein A